MIVRNISRVSGLMNTHHNSGIASTNLVVYLEGFRTVWYHKEEISNILSLAKIQEKYHIAYTSQDGNALLVVNPDV